MNTKALIELVRENPELYETNNPNYVRTKLKDGLWEKIGAELGTDGKAAKEQWRKLRECHREALRRQQRKKSGDPAERSKPWIYQRQMEFLLAYMKTRSNHTNIQEDSLEDSATILEIKYTHDVENEDTAEVGESKPITTSKAVKSVSVENEIPPPKKMKSHGDRLLEQFVDSSGKRAKRYEEVRQMIFEKGECSQHNQNDVLYQFFYAMYLSTKDLPNKYQRQVRNKLYDAVAQAEEQYANETCVT